MGQHGWVLLLVWPQGVYALAPAKQQAVAEETLAVWCSMAGSLGWHGLKVRLECYIVKYVVMLGLQGLRWMGGGDVCCRLGAGLVVRHGWEIR
jgi:Flp pilus assembly protein protease CpaA